MKNNLFKNILQLALALVATALLAGPSFALEVDLVAEEFVLSIDPDGAGGVLPPEDIAMWGFASSPGGAASAPGPRITVPPGDTTLTINLINNLPEAISIVIPGQPGTLDPQRNGSGRVTSLTTTTVGNGGTGTYTWTGLNPGTFIYHSGTDLAKQVHMGLYGAVTVEAVAGEVYPGIAYDNETVLFYSEIDPALHDPPAFTHSNNYNPRYFLVNGRPYQNGDAAIPAGNVSQTTLVRMLSASLGDLVPTILGMSWQMVAEDGNPYPYPRNQHTTLLSALKTKDALLTPTNAGTFTVFDRRGNLANDGVEPGGMIAQLEVETPAGAPVANSDSATVVEGGTVTELDSLETSVLANDTGTDLEASLVSNPANAAFFALNANGTFSYTHNGSETTGDAFTYRATNPTQQSNVTTVFITITPQNDAPVAADDAYDVIAGQTLEVAAPGVLANDSDADGDPLTSVLVTNVTAGTLALAANGSFAYAPDTNTTADSFTYSANDGTVNSLTPATVNITVTAAPANQPPVANDDFATTQRNTPVTIDLTANDTDPDGNLNPASVSVGTVSSRGGSIIDLNTGSVVYTPPRRNFRGTDTFTYTVDDTENATSNEATVQVNVVK